MYAISGLTTWYWVTKQELLSEEDCFSLVLSIAKLAGGHDGRFPPSILHDY